MRARMSFQSSTSCAPKKLRAKIPVPATITMVRIAPGPDMDAEPVLGAHGLRQQQQRLIERIEDELSTQSVMTIGIQISSPVMKYFFTPWTPFSSSKNKKARLAPGLLFASWLPLRLRLTRPAPPGQPVAVALGFESGLESVFVSLFVSGLDSVFVSVFASVFDRPFSRPASWRWS